MDEDEDEDVGSPEGFFEFHDKMGVLAERVGLLASKMRLLNDAFQEVGTKRA